MMHYAILFALLVFAKAFGDVSIDTQVDKSTLTISEKAEVAITLSYPQSSPPDIFAFLYTLMHDPPPHFQLVDTKVDQNKIHITLQPLSTGKLIFAPGVIHFGSMPYIVPPVVIDCKTIGVTSLPMAGLLPLYPERRIELTPANRVRIMNDEVLKKALHENQESFGRYRFSWDVLAFILGVVSFGSIALWGVSYYELVERLKRPQPAPELPIDKAQRMLEDASPLSWQRIVDALRLALGERDTKGAFELRECVQTNAQLTEEDKTTLSTILTTLGGILYAAKPASIQEWNKLHESVLLFITKRKLGP